MFEYFKDKISNKKKIFLKKMHSLENTFNKQCDDFKGKVQFFSWNYKLMWGKN